MYCEPVNPISSAQVVEITANKPTNCPDIKTLKTLDDFISWILSNLCELKGVLSDQDLSCLRTQMNEVLTCDSCDKSWKAFFDLIVRAICKSLEQSNKVNIPNFLSHLSCFTSLPVSKPIYTPEEAIIILSDLLCELKDSLNSTNLQIPLAIGWNGTLFASIRNGQVFLDGNVFSSSNSIITTLPIQYRPLMERTLVIATSNININTYLRIRTNGIVEHIDTYVGGTVLYIHDTYLTV